MRAAERHTRNDTHRAVAQVDQLQLAAPAADVEHQLQHFRLVARSRDVNGREALIVARAGVLAAVRQRPAHAVQFLSFGEGEAASARQRRRDACVQECRDQLGRAWFFTAVRNCCRLSAELVGGAMATAEGAAYVVFERVRCAFLLALDDDQLRAPFGDALCESAEATSTERDIVCPTRSLVLLSARSTRAAVRLRSADGAPSSRLRSPHAVCDVTLLTCNACATHQDALKAEIERKRKAKELEFGEKKYARLADIEAAREGQHAHGGAAGGAGDAAAQVCWHAAHALGLLFLASSLRTLTPRMRLPQGGKASEAVSGAADAVRGHEQVFNPPHPC